ncbi:glyoxalase, partial [Klebsiella pneumoniae]|nr:glyoxalase [Klebsiella pneumoniae]
MKKTIDHIGIAVRDIDSTIRFYENVLLGTLIDRYVSEAPGVESEVAILEVDGDRIE